MIRFDCDIELPFMDCCNDCEDCPYFLDFVHCGYETKTF